MLSLDRCKDILNQYDYKLDNEQIKEVREFLYKMAEIQLNIENNE